VTLRAGTEVPGGQDSSRLVRRGLRLLSIALSLMLFMFSLALLREGARPLAPFLRNRISIDSPASSLGFGWLLAMVALSGSPVAATSLTLLDAGVLSVKESYAMIAGSRLGAAFIVLLIGFIYLLRGRSREHSLGAGLVSLLVTQTIYIPAVTLGLLALDYGWLDRWMIRARPAMTSPVSILFDPAVAAVGRLFPSWGLLPLGFLAILASFALIDRALPDLHLEQTSVGRVNRLLYRPIVTFLLGAAVTTLTMSVSISLSLLVPLSVRGYIRQENAIPYIMGANITTFDDTLVAAALLANPAAVTIVLVLMVSVALMSVLILAFGFRPYERALSRLAVGIESQRRYVAAYLLLTLAVPLALIFLL
jgi:sodium-dependent phosphate cotransporter